MPPSERYNAPPRDVSSLATPSSVAAPVKSKLSELLGSLDDAVSKAETAKSSLEKKNKEVAELQAAHDAAVKSVLDLQVQLRERLGSVVGVDARVRVS